MKRFFKCDYCGKEVVSSDTREYKHHFCNRICKGKWSSENLVGNKAAHWKGGGIEVECFICKNTKIVEKWHYNRNVSKYNGIFTCSPECEAIYRTTLVGEESSHWQGGGIKVRCRNCGKPKIVRKYERNVKKLFFCDNKCRWEYTVGRNHHMWLGGNTEYGPEFTNELKAYIRECDGHVCAVCNKKSNGQPFSVHHIDYDKMNNDERNLITLCPSCHAMTNTNREYWMKFFKPIMAEKYMSQETLAD